jgi:hypothetical protein
MGKTFIIYIISRYRGIYGTYGTDRYYVDRDRRMSSTNIGRRAFGIIEDGTARYRRYLSTKIDRKNFHSIYYITVPRGIDGTYGTPIHYIDRDRRICSVNIAARRALRQNRARYLSTKVGEKNFHYIYIITVPRDIHGTYGTSMDFVKRPSNLLR